MTISALTEPRIGRIKTRTTQQNLIPSFILDCEILVSAESITLSMTIPKIMMSSGFIGMRVGHLVI